MMTHVQNEQKPVTVMPSVTPVRKGLLQRKCACGGTPGASGECEACRKKQLGLQRKSRGQNAPATVPATVHEVIRSSGEPLSRETQSFMESRFQHDFSRVRIHDTPVAHSSAYRLGARAYTLGQDIVFAKSEYQPRSASGRQLIAHELAHTVQQGETNQGLFDIAPDNSALEREADSAARAVRVHDGATRHFTKTPPSIQRTCGRTAISALSHICLGRGGDITDFGSSSDNLYFFNVNCDEFASGEEARLRGFASTITALDTIDIDGFASEEGPLDYNYDLSCARAHKVKTVLEGSGVSSSQINQTFAHGPTPGSRPEHRSAVITVHRPTPEPEEEQPATPSPIYVACYDGANVYVNKNGRAHHCAAVTGSVGGPTPDGDYCIREQGAAQLGWIPFVRDHSNWYLLEPQFSTTRFRMHLHPGSVSAGCVTVTDTRCFGRIAGILNRSGRITRDGYDGYPPGNSEGVTNPKRSVTCVGLLTVRRRAGGCSFMTSSP